MAGKSSSSRDVPDGATLALTPRYPSSGTNLGMWFLQGTATLPHQTLARRWQRQTSCRYRPRKQSDSATVLALAALFLENCGI